ncbi:unnamed protein product [Blepharisma stoltei]|uniref:C2H2-type domain-containing protein n=1 Tax=Blepharisma stoltei TaxID=1481888 RepID=A0AAU9JFI7_9CILI|nr:unnamed protein product [Blepharisma stoltei]
MDIESIIHSRQQFAMNWLSNYINLSQIFTAYSLQKSFEASTINQKLDKNLAEKIEKNNFHCTVCNKDFNSYKGLKQHIGKSHDNTVKNFCCETCSRLFNNKYALKFHIRQVHEKSTAVKCDACEKVFYNKYKLKEHSTKAHNNL